MLYENIILLLYLFWAAEALLIRITSALSFIDALYNNWRGVSYCTKVEKINLLSAHQQHVLQLCAYRVVNSDFIVKVLGTLYLIKCYDIHMHIYNLVVGSLNWRQHEN